MSIIEKLAIGAGKVLNKAVSAYNSSMSKVSGATSDFVSGVRWGYKKISDKFLASFGYATNADVYAIG